MTSQRVLRFLTANHSLRGAVGLAAWLALSAPAVAQEPLLVGGLPVEPAVEGSFEGWSLSANTVIVKTVDGVRHVFHFTKDLVVHGSKGTTNEALKGISNGTTVVVHFSVAGGEASAEEIDRIGENGLKVSEGIVTRIDRKRKEIVVRFPTGTEETLQLTDRAAQKIGKDIDSAAGGSTRVAVYYTDEAGHKVVHFFKKVK